MIPGARLARGAAAAGARRVVRAGLEHLPEAVHAARTGWGNELADSDGGDVPAGMRAGDVIIEWPVHRSVWRRGREDASPRVAVGRGIALLPPAQDYRTSSTCDLAPAASPSSPSRWAREHRYAARRGLRCARHPPRVHTPPAHPAGRRKELPAWRLHHTHARRAHGAERARTGHGRVRRHRARSRGAARRSRRCDRQQGRRTDCHSARPSPAGSGRTSRQYEARLTRWRRSPRCASRERAWRTSVPASLLGHELGCRLRAGRHVHQAPEVRLDPPARGSDSVNAAPPPVRSPTLSVPPIACASSEATGRPRPMP